ncbi:MAG: hypothetical protein IIW66_02895, partial [Bacteroidales bacterium]|nr:hypothetical protein [Bacteroidales bacterium]
SVAYTSMKINMSTSVVSLDNSGRAFDINASSNGYLTFTYTTSSFWGSTTYYLAINGGENGLQVSQSDGDTRRWYLRKVTKTPISVQYKKFTGVDPEVDFYSSYPVNYLDKYGAPQPLQHICRNEHINLTVNVTHNSELGTFSFQVEDWEPAENKTTFD